MAMAVKERGFQIVGADLLIIQEHKDASISDLALGLSGIFIHLSFAKCRTQAAESLPLTLSSHNHRLQFLSSCQVLDQVNDQIDLGLHIQ